MLDYVFIVVLGLDRHVQVRCQPHAVTRCPITIQNTGDFARIVRLQRRSLLRVDKSQMFRPDFEDKRKCLRERIKC